MEYEGRKPSSPFKFNNSLLAEEEFRGLFIREWNQFDKHKYDSEKFTNNLKRVKGLVVEWSQIYD